MKWLFLIIVLSFSSTAVVASKKDNKAIMNKATQDLKDSDLEEKALTAGLKIPQFEVGGKPISSYYEKKPLIITFYRGHWCPYCVTELKDYQKVYTEIQIAGAELMAIAPDKPFFLKKTKKEHKLKFPLYQDKENKIAKQFGLAFKLKPELLNVYKTFGINLDESQGNERRELPMPGTYVIDKKGTIVYAFFDADYKKRADPQEVLKVVKNLRK